MKKRNLKGNNKGFTLVELIVVLVILAILAAILVPALLGYIDQARNKQSLLNARSVLTAAQAELSSIYGSSTAVPSDLNSSSNAHYTNFKSTADLENLSPEVVSIEIYTGAAYEAGDGKSRKSQHQAFTVVGMKYTDEAGTVYYTGGEWFDEETTVSGNKIATITK